MILPSKHLNVSESLIGLGAFIVSILNKPMLVDDCWIELNRKYIETKKIKKHHSFDNFILTIELLYCIGLVDINREGEIYCVFKEANCEL